MYSHVVTAGNVDLSNCDREQVQFCGAIQPHGALLVVQEPDLRVLQASLNIETVTGIPHEEVVGATIDRIFEGSTTSLLTQLSSTHLEGGPAYVLRESFAGSRNGVNIFAHRSAGQLLIELEVIPAAPLPAIVDLYSQLRAQIVRLQSTPRLQDFFDLAVAQIRHFTGYHRVMAYKFDADGSGHVIAEAKADGLESYLGLHYPASDIPTPARRLFGLSWLRHLPDVNYTPVPIEPERSPATEQPVDLSYSILRSVSIMYSEYLKNMGVGSTMVMPLLKEGRLWGLISAMHHGAPWHVPYEVRMAAEFLAHMLSLLMAAKEDAETYEQRLRMGAVTEQLTQAFNREQDFHTALAKRTAQTNLLAQIPAGGAAVVSRNKVSTLGSTPSEQEILSLVKWLEGRCEPSFATDRLEQLYAPAAAYKANASGLLAIHLAHHKPEYLLWFRPERVQNVYWAGDPNKPVETLESGGLLILRPRNSFALWKESVEGRSEPWLDYEIEAVLNLRRTILEAVLGRAEEIEKINRELTDLNIELDSFAYAASHDLKEPLRGIHHLATFLKRGGSLSSAQAQQQLDSIMRLSRRMDELIEALLNYSRTGRAELVIERYDLDELVDSALLACKQRIEETSAEVRRPSALGRVDCDAVRMREVFTNLIGNALKYNDKTSRWIEIGVRREERPPQYYVRDNGIGIAERDRERIFQIFRRLHGRDEFGGGSGAGLTIARKTVERHGGRLWVESKVGEGSTFFFTIGTEAKT